MPVSANIDEADVGRIRPDRRESRRAAQGVPGRDGPFRLRKVEAVVLSLVGGSIGIALGFGLSQGLTFWLAWPTPVSTSAVAIAFGFAAATGVFFRFNRP